MFKMRSGREFLLDRAGQMKNAECAFMVSFAVTITHNFITQEK